MIAGSKVVMIFANTYYLDVTVEWVTQISIQSQLKRNGKAKVIKSNVPCPNMFLNMYQILR